MAAGGVNYYGYATLATDIVLDIAARLLPSRRSLDAMRGACRAWRQIIPPTSGVWLCISPSALGVGCTSIFEIAVIGGDHGGGARIGAGHGGGAGIGTQGKGGAQIAAATEEVAAVGAQGNGDPQIAAGAFLRPVPLLALRPSGVICWGCISGVLAIRGRDGCCLSCIICGKGKKLVDLPGTEKPRAFFEIPTGPITIPTVSCILSDKNDIFWDWYMEPWPPEARKWKFMPQVEEYPPRSYCPTKATDARSHYCAKSLVDVRFTLFILAYPNILLIDRKPYARLQESVSVPKFVYSDDEDDDTVGDVLRVYLPLDQSKELELLRDYGHHIFEVAGEPFICILLRDTANPERLVGKLFCVARDEHEEYVILPRKSIGKFCLYLGTNQPFVLPATESIDSQENVAYVVDQEADTPCNRVVMLNFETQDCQFIPYPAGFQDKGIWATAGWVSPPIETRAPQFEWHCLGVGEHRR